MADNLKDSLDRLPLTRLGGAAGVIGQTLTAGQGVRLGHSAVLSTKVHAFQSHNPEHVQILLNTDAGQVFYHRQDSGAVYHLDIFHQCGEVDHQIAARYICLAVDCYNQRAAKHTELVCKGGVNPGLIDIQTATGGGRITGNLQGGQKLSVRRVHENHVHVALSIPADELICLFYIVAAAETAIANSGLELRCNERISHVNSADCQADLSPYTDQTDSLLTGQQPAGQSGQTVRQTSNETQSPVFSPPPETVGSPALPARGQPISEGGRGQTLVGIKPLRQGCDSRQNEMQQQTTPAPARIPVTAFYASGLQESLRQAVRKAQNRPGVITEKTKRQNDRAAGRRTTTNMDIPFTAEFDVAATVSAAAARLLGDGIPGRLHISPADLRFVGRRPRRGSDICLLTDCSGSMAGPRLQAAQYLAGELSRYGCSRLGLITFQDDQADLIRSLTPSRHAVLRAFETITPSGATPLALGIRRSLTYINEQQATKPLLVLITDGIPSRKYVETVNPLTDALAAAAEIKQTKCAFLCIGLDADDGFLRKLADTAGGVAYIFSEFEKQILSMAHQSSFK